MTLGMGGANTGVCAAMVCLFIARNSQKMRHALPPLFQKKMGSILDDLKHPKLKFKGATAVMLLTKDNPEPVFDSKARVSHTQNAIEKHIEQNQHDPTNKLAAAQFMIQMLADLQNSEKGTLSQAVMAKVAAERKNAFWYMSEKGHAWSVVVRKEAADPKFKLMDPTHGIMRFDSEESLYAGAWQYQEGNTQYLLIRE